VRALEDTLGVPLFVRSARQTALTEPLLALFPALSDRLAGRVQQRSDDALAEDRRLLADLFSLATSPESARELRTYGVTDALAARHVYLALDRASAF
jgi:DNA-binding transcriptional LysR family regulator